ncbi:hypothetical protein [Pseudomonas sp. CAM1A]|uniref:hypothetical protein n=1 Tax=Pseudomonas sp. CAM1A TaxID=3231717 RepID=UPI0039C60A56
MHIKKSLAFLIAMGSTSSVFAALSANIEIAGKVTPTACSIVASQAKLDLGSIQPDATGKVAEITKSLGTLTLTCAAPAQVHLGFLTSGITSAGSKQIASAWTQDGKSLSQLFVMPTSVTNNNVAGNLMIQPNPSSLWVALPATGSIPLSTADGNRTAFAGLNQQALAITSATIELSAKFLEVPKVDFTKGEISANQSLTFELKYL